MSEQKEVKSYWALLKHHSEPKLFLTKPLSSKGIFELIMRSDYDAQSKLLQEKDQRIAELEQHYEVADEFRIQYKEELLAAKEEIQRLREALQFYERGDNITDQTCETYVGKCPKDTDHGDVARKALTAWEKFGGENK